MNEKEIERLVENFWGTTDSKFDYKPYEFRISAVYRDVIKLIFPEKFASENKIKKRNVKRYRSKKNKR